MKKIVIINHYGITPDLPGATKHYDMAKYFSGKKAHKVEFWMCGYNHHEGKNHSKLKGLRLQAAETEKNLKIVRIKSSSYRKSNLMRQLNITLFDIITACKIVLSKDIDIVVLSVPPISIFNALAVRLKKIKLITDVEDLWPLFLIEMGMTNKIAISYMEKCANYLYRNSNGISAVSDGMKEYVEKNTRKQAIEIWLAPLGINLNEYKRKGINNELLINKVWKNDFKIMYIGAHGRANNLGSVLETIKEFNRLSNKRVSFIFIGDGDQKNNLINYSKNLALENVFFEKAIPSKRVPVFLECADICLTNLEKIESFKLVRPNKLFQYMALEKPIICGIWGESQTIVETANAGIYVDFTDCKGAAEKIYKMINDKEKLKEYGANGMKYVKQFGDREIIFEDYYKRITRFLQLK